MPLLKISFTASSLTRDFFSCRHICLFPVPVCFIVMTMSNVIIKTWPCSSLFSTISGLYFTSNPERKRDSKWSSLMSQTDKWTNLMSTVTPYYNLAQMRDFIGQIKFRELLIYFGKGIMNHLCQHTLQTIKLAHCCSAKSNTQQSCQPKCAQTKQVQSALYLEEQLWCSCY